MAFRPQFARPIMRGVRLAYGTGTDERFAYLEYHSDGSIDLGFGSTTSEHMLPVAQILAHLINVFRVIEYFRTSGHAPDAEYAVDVEIHGQPNEHPIILTRPSDIFSDSHIGRLDELPVPLPRLSFGPMAEIDRALSELYTDMRDACGSAYTLPGEVRVNQSPPFWQVG